MQQQEKEVFQQYEIKNWEFSPRLYKIVAAAATFYVLTLLVIAQTNLLTMKGCESPLVGRFCQVLDTVYVTSVLFGTDSEFESRDYEKTTLADADITWIDRTGDTPPLTYPEGYFALANPEEYAARQNMYNDDFSMVNPIPGFPGIPGSPPMVNGMDLMNTPQVVPTPNNNPVTGTLPDMPFSMGVNPVPPPPRRSANPPRAINRRPAKVRNNTTNLEDKMAGVNQAKPEEKKDESPQPDIASLPVDENKLNKKPLEDFGDEVLARLDDKTNKLDLSKNFLVVMDGTIKKDGKLDKDPKKSRFVRNEGDAEMIDVAKAAIEAVSDSGILGYLRDLGVEKVQFTLVQDEKQIYAIITSDQTTEAKARTVSSGLNTLISIAKGNIKEEDVKTLLNSAKVEPKGKNFTVNFAIPKPAAHEMINRKLKEAEAKKKAEKNKPNSTAQTNNVNPNAAR